jgi:hypothetical protein
MFLIEHQWAGVTNLIFTWQDPCNDGFTGAVIEGVSLDYDMNHVHLWPDGHERPEAITGQDPANPKQYKVFKYARDLQGAGFRPVVGTANVFGRWADYTRLIGS